MKLTSYEKQIKYISIKPSAEIISVKIFKQSMFCRLNYERVLSNFPFYCKLLYIEEVISKFPSINKIASRNNVYMVLCMTNFL